MIFQSYGWDKICGRCTVGFSLGRRAHRHPFSQSIHFLDFLFALGLLLVLRWFLSSLGSNFCFMSFSMWNFTHYRYFMVHTRSIVRNCKFFTVAIHIDCSVPALLLDWWMLGGRRRLDHINMSWIRMLSSTTTTWQMISLRVISFKLLARKDNLTLGGILLDNFFFFFFGARLILQLMLSCKFIHVIVFRALRQYMWVLVSGEESHWLRPRTC